MSLATITETRAAKSTKKRAIRVDDFIVIEDGAGLFSYGIAREIDGDMIFAEIICYLTDELEPIGNLIYQHEYFFASDCWRVPHINIETEETCH